MSFPEGSKESEEEAGDFTKKRIGKTQYFVCYIKDITMLGLDVVKQLPINFPHRILHIKGLHKDSAHAVNTDNLALTFEVPQNAIPNFPYWQDQLWKDLFITDSRFTHAFKENEGGVFGNRIYKLTLNTTTTHLVTVRIKIQRVGRMV